MGGLCPGAWRLLAFVLFVAACGPTAEPRWAGDPESLVPELCGDVPKGGKKLPSKAAELRDEGMKALHDGDLIAASQAFEEAIDLAPTNVALVALLGVANDGLSILAKETGKAWDEVRPVKLEALTADKLAGPMGEPLAVRQLGTLSVAGEDDLRAVGRSFSRNLVPQVLRRVYALQSFAVHEDRGVVTYTRNQRNLVLQVGPNGGESSVRIADYAKFVDKEEPKSVQILSAVFSDDMIYTAMVFNDATSLFGHNRHTGEAVWRIPVGNMRHVGVVADHLIGVVNQELVVFDRQSGRQLARHTMAQWPHQLVVRDDYIFAVTGTTAQVFELGPSRGATVRHDESLAAFIRRVSGEEKVSPANVFASPPDAAIDIAPQHRCGVAYALTELDSGRYASAATRLTRMEAVYPTHPVVLALTATSRFMERRAAETIDLTDAPTRKLEKLMAASTTHAIEGKASLTEVSTRPAEDLRRWASRSHILRYSLDPDALPQAIPRHYGRFEISEWSGDEEGHHVVIYGGRYVVLVQGDEVEAALDGSTLFDDAAAPSPLSTGSRLGTIHLAMRRENALIVSFTDPMSRRGLASIDITSGRPTWRTSTDMQPVSFVVADDRVVATWGSKLYVLRHADGVVVGESDLRDAPRALAFADERILVNGFSGSTEYTLTHDGG